MTEPTTQNYDNLVKQLRESDRLVNVDNKIMLSISEQNPEIITQLQKGSPTDETRYFYYRVGNATPAMRIQENSEGPFSVALKNAFNFSSDTTVWQVLKSESKISLLGAKFKNFGEKFGMGGRKSRRSRKSKKSRKHRKGKSRRSRQ